MLRSFGFASLALSALAALAFLPPANGQRDASGKAVEILPVDGQAGASAAARVPLLVVDRSGSTLLGPAHMHLIVYSDGHVAFVSRSGAPGDAHDRTLKLSAASVSELHARLLRGKAGELESQRTGATDMPLTTMTVLSAKAQSSAHTFSYWVPTDGYAAVDAVLAALVEALKSDSKQKEVQIGFPTD